jgi:hypothetical protein
MGFAPPGPLPRSYSIEHSTTIDSIILYLAPAPDSNDETSLFAYRKGLDHGAFLSCIHAPPGAEVKACTLHDSFQGTLEVNIDPSSLATSIPNLSE